MNKTTKENFEVDNDKLEKYRASLIEILNTSQNHFEKQLSFISAGSLGLSFIIIEKIFTNIEATRIKPVLICGWVTLGLALLLNLYSHFHAVNSHYKTITEIDQQIKDKIPFRKQKPLRRRNTINILNLISIILIALGIGLILAYTSINIYKR